MTNHFFRKYIAYDQVFLQALDFSMTQSQSVKYKDYQQRLKLHLTHADQDKRTKAEILQFLFTKGGADSFNEALNLLKPYYEFMI